MQPLKTKEAKARYNSRDFIGALRIYSELASSFGPQLFYANMALCLKALQGTNAPILETLDGALGGTNADLLKSISQNIVVSLTSYPARIETVHVTVESILGQTLRPSKVVLWLAEEQFPGKEASLPPSILQLKDKGLSLGWCEDLRSYKKLVPSRKAHPNAIIVTADDDITYSPNWLLDLVLHHISEPDAIVCHRAHQVALAEDSFAPYRSWPQDIKTNTSAYDHLFTGCGGVLYPPRCLPDTALDSRLFSRLCPDGDDLWFWSMSVLHGTRTRIVQDSDFSLQFVDGTQDTALWQANVRGGGNDRILGNLNREFPQLVNIVKSQQQERELKRPKVSVIVPVFNTGEHLKTCLESIQGQTLKSIEILCIDDGSTDPRTEAILLEHLKLNDRLVVIRQKNSGPATARNLGLRRANGTYVAFVDSDDHISPDYLETLYNQAERCSANITIANKILCFGRDTETIEKNVGHPKDRPNPSKGVAASMIIASGVTWNKLYRRSFLQENGLNFLDGMKCAAEDNYFSIRALATGFDRLTFADGGTYYYRQHANSITKLTTSAGFDDCVAVYKQTIESIKKSKIADMQYWLAVANQRAIRDLRYISRTLEKSTEAQGRIYRDFYVELHLCCIADHNYVLPTLVFLESLKRSRSRSTRLSVTILAPRGSGEAMQILTKLSDESIKISVQEVDSDRFANLHKYKDKDNYCMASPAAMFKFIIPNIFPHLDRILYIDTDLIVRRDLTGLFLTDIGENYVGAIPDLWNSVTDRQDIKKYRSYFNSGVMLMNLVAMRKADLPAKLIDAKMRSTNFNLMDQDVFNEVCNENVRALDVKFNFLPVCFKRHKHRFDLAELNRIYGTSYRAVEDIAADPVVAHWAGSDKPWINDSTAFSSEWMDIYCKLRASIDMSQLNFSVRQTEQT